MAISDQLTLLNNTKTAIRTAINNKGGSVSASDTFASYATAIDNLPSGGSGNKVLDSIDVSDFSGTTFQSGSKYITGVTIPSGVTTIANYAFQNYTGLTSITIPSSVTSLGLSMCKGCTGLTSATILCNCNKISVFEDCTGLTTVTFGYQGQQLTIGEQSFKNCTSLTSVRIPSNIVNIEVAAFYNCTSLTYVIVEATTPPTINAVSNGGAFGNTNNCPIYVPAASVDAYKAASNWSTYASRLYPITQLATVDGNPVYNYEIGNTDSTTISDTERSKIPTGDSIEFAEGVTQIGGQLGAYEEVVLPSTFLSFNDTQPINAATTTLTSKATTPPSVERSNLGGSGLTAVYVPSESVDTYKAASGWSTFASIIQAIPVPTALKWISADGTQEFSIACEDLTTAGTLTVDDIMNADPNNLIVDVEGSAEIGGCVTSIAGSAFVECYSLTSANIPSGVTSIGSQAFFNCTSLTSVTVNATTPPTLGIQAFDSTNNCPIYVPAASVNTYKAASGWSTYASRIQAIPTE